MKLNWDAAVDKTNGKIGMGIIAKDHGGSVVAMACGSRYHISDPEMAETLAAREAIELGKDMGWQKIILEGDALEVVKALMKDEISMGPQGQIIKDAKELMNCGIMWKVQYVHREANEAAHQLAKMGLHQNDLQIWFTDFPVCIIDTVLAEQEVIII